MPGFICLLMKSVTWNLEAVLSTLGMEENYWGRGVAAHPWWCGEHHGNRFLFLPCVFLFTLILQVMKKRKEVTLRFFRQYPPRPSIESDCLCSLWPIVEVAGTDRVRLFGIFGCWQRGNSMLFHQPNLLVQSWSRSVPLTQAPSKGWVGPSPAIHS